MKLLIPIVSVMIAITACAVSTPETDHELVYRTLLKSGSDISYFSIDKEYSGNAGRFFFVRVSNGNSDTVLVIVGIRERRNFDIATIVNSVPMILTEELMTKYIDCLEGDTVYKFADENEFWNDTLVWANLEHEYRFEDTAMRPN